MDELSAVLQPQEPSEDEFANMIVLVAVALRPPLNYGCASLSAIGLVSCPRGRDLLLLENLPTLLIISDVDDDALLTML